MPGFVLQVVALICLLSASLSDGQAPSNKMLICSFSAAYYSKDKFTPEMIDPKLCTHIHYDFAVLNDKFQIDFANRDVEQSEKLYERVVALKQQNPDLKVILSIGGWSDSSKKYSDLVADEYKRTLFIVSVVPLLQKYGFDGLDIAWEYPNCWQGNCGVNPDDVQNFVTFLTELRSDFDSEKLILSASVSALRDEVDEAYDVPNVSKQLHHINVMSYDWHGKWDKTTGHHAQFYRHPDDLIQSMNLNDSVSHWIYRGADPAKLVIGIPSYGRAFTLVDPAKNGLNAPALGPGRSGPYTKEQGLLGFNEICHELDKWTHIEDPRVGTYSFKGDQWVGFDSPRVAVAKARFISKNNLGGAAFKYLFTDDFESNCFGYNYPILRGIKYGLSTDEIKEFETTETDIRTFVEKVQLSIIVQDEEHPLEQELKEGVNEDNIMIKLTEREVTNSGEVELKHLEVNAGTLDATGDQDAETLERIHFTLMDK